MLKIVKLEHDIFLNTLNYLYGSKVIMHIIILNNNHKRSAVELKYKWKNVSLYELYRLALSEYLGAIFVKNL